MLKLESHSQWEFRISYKTNTFFGVIRENEATERLICISVKYHFFEYIFSRCIWRISLKCPITIFWSSFLSAPSLIFSSSTNCLAKLSISLFILSKSICCFFLLLLLRRELTFFKKYFSASEFFPSYLAKRFRYSLSPVTVSVKPFCENNPASVF